MRSTNSTPPSPGPHRGDLAAALLDFRLDRAADLALETHLAACPRCRSLADGFAADAAGLAGVHPVPPPDRVAEAVLRAIAQPVPRRIPRRASPRALLLLAGIVCALFLLFVIPAVERLVR